MVFSGNVVFTNILLSIDVTEIVSVKQSRTQPESVFVIRTADKLKYRLKLVALPSVSPRAIIQIGIEAFKLRKPGNIPSP